MLSATRFFARRTPLKHRTMSTTTTTTTTAILPPNRRPDHWKTLAPTAPAGTKTYGAQASLPKLPVPALADTLQRLKQSIEPLSHSKDEYATAVRKIDAFATSDLAQVLQIRLENRAQETSHWLEQWWDDGAYMGYRDSVIVNVSYYYGFQDPATTKKPVTRAAEIIRSAMLSRDQLRRGELEPEATKEGPIDMDTYRWMFDCSRVPGTEGLDWYVTYTQEHDTNSHVVVMRNNRPWRIDVLRDGKLLSVEALEAQLQHIYDNSTGEYPGVGVLTASNRDVWAKDYVHLTSDPKNKSILKTIHSAAFLVSLDSNTPSEPISFSRELWHGGLSNRWVDKPVEFIVYDNGKAGILGEHAVMDGTPTVRLCDDVINRIASPSFDRGSALSSSPSQPEPLDWNVTPTTRSAISAAETAAAELCGSQALSVHRTPYGKRAIKAFGVSPDSWAQLVVQLAYLRLLGSDLTKRVGGTYEAASTRKFFKGRTEAIRVVTAASDAWTKSMDDPAASADDKKKLFAEAVKAHVQSARASGAGQGIDRHLFGLKKILKEGENMPEFLLDPLVQRSSYWVLSTSAIFSKHFDVYGWGEVVPDGFGVAYMTGFDDYLQYTITSRKEMPNTEFTAEIARAAQDLYALHAGENILQRSSSVNREGPARTEH